MLGDGKNSEREAENILELRNTHWATMSVVTMRGFGEMECRKRGWLAGAMA